MNARSCASCQRPLRPTHSRAAQYPGTVVHHSHGRCAGCMARVRRGASGPVGSDARPPIVYDVDVVAVELAEQGERVRLNAGERHIAILDLTRRGKTAREIAMLLRINPRTVARHRNGHTRPRIDEEPLAA